MKKIILAIICAFAFLLVLNTSIKLNVFEPRNASVASISFAPSSALAYEPGDPTVVTKVLSGKDVLADGKINGAWVQTFYKFCRALMNVVLLIALLIFAFANILHIQIETYAIKKLLPKLIVVAVAGNIAMPLIALASRIMDSLMTISIFRPLPTADFFTYIMGTGADTFHRMGALALAALVASVVTGGLGGLSLAACGCIVVFGAMLITLGLSLILSFRTYIVFLLAAVSPVAFALTLLPFTEPWYKRWWQSIFIPWFTLPLVIWPIIHLGQIIPSSMGNVGDGSVASIIGFFLPMVIRAGLLILAIRYPFTMEKDLSSMIHSLGKLTGQGLQTAGGNISDYLYKGNKNWARAKGTKAVKIKEDELNTLYAPGGPGVTAATDKQRTAMEDEIAKDPTGTLAKSVKWDAASGSYTDGGDAFNRELDLRTRTFISRDRQMQLDKARNDAEQGHLKSRWGRTLAIGAGLTSLPIGLQVAIKAKREIAAEERSKTSQKALGDGLAAVIDPAEKLKETNIKGFNVNPFNPRYIRGFLGDLKYFERIAKDDLQGNRTPEAIMSYMGWDVFEKLREAVKGDYPTMSDEEADQLVKQELDVMFNNAENVGTWANSYYVKKSGLQGGRVAKLKVGYERMKQETIRELSQRGGRRAEAETRILGLMGGSAGGAMHYEDEEVAPGTGSTGPTAQKADPETLKYLQQIAAAVSKNNPDALHDSILAAQTNGISDQQLGQLFGPESESLTRLTTYARLAGIKDNQLLLSLQRMRATEAAPEIGSIKATIEGSTSLTPEQKTEALSACDDLLAKKYAVAGASANTADAQAIQIQSGPLAVKIQQEITNNPNIVMQLREASQGLMEGAGSPEQIATWSRLIGEHLPGAVGTTGPQGEKTYDLSPSTIATFDKSLDTINLDRI